MRKNTMNNNEEPLPVLECEVRDAILTLKNRKPSVIDIIPSELLKHGKESLLKIHILKTKKWPDL